MRPADAIDARLEGAGWRVVAHLSGKTADVRDDDLPLLFGGDAGALAPLFAARGEAAIPPSLNGNTFQTGAARCAG